MTSRRPIHRTAMLAVGLAALIAMTACSTLAPVTSQHATPASSTTTPADTDTTEAESGGGKVSTGRPSNRDEPVASTGLPSPVATTAPQPEDQPAPTSSADTTEPASEPAATLPPKVGQKPPATPDATVDGGVDVERLQEVTAGVIELIDPAGEHAKCIRVEIAELAKVAPDVLATGTSPSLFPPQAVATFTAVGACFQDDYPSVDDTFAIAVTELLTRSDAELAHRECVAATLAGRIHALGGRYVIDEITAMVDNHPDGSSIKAAVILCANGAEPVDSIEA